MLKTSSREGQLLSYLHNGKFVKNEQKQTHKEKNTKNQKKKTIKRPKNFLKWPTQELPWKFQYIPGNSGVFFFFFQKKDWLTSTEAKRMQCS